MAYDIESPTNERVKRLVRLRDRGHRDAEGVFIVEGERVLRRAIAAGHAPTEVYGNAPGLPETGEKRWSVSPAAMAKASYRSSPDAVIGVFEQFRTDLAGLVPGTPALVLIAESVEKPGNLGAILRTSDAFGADGVVGTGHGVDPFNPNVIRASTGAVFSVPYAWAGLAELTSWLDTAGIRLIAASPDGEAAPRAVDMTGPVALMVGSEARGLTVEAAAAADRQVRIPMAGSVDSLNASISMAILVYEAVRQRSAS